MSFVHLHTHTAYSYLDGISDYKKLVEKAKAAGMPALAITDHGNMDCAIRFYKAAKKSGIKPIIGCELYFTRDPSSRSRDDTYHLTALAATNEGYKNLMSLVSRANDYLWYKPRVTPDLLKEYGKGLIGMSACLAGEVASAALRYDDNRQETLRSIVTEYQGWFSEGFYLECMLNGYEGQMTLLPHLEWLEKETGAMRVATNDVHYLDREDGPLRSCVSRNSKDRYGENEEGQLWLRTPEEMREIFPAEICDRTLEIAEQCNVEIQLGKHVWPAWQSPPNMTPEDELRQKAENGLVMRKKADNPEYRQRLQEELDQIVANGFATYLLIVADFIAEARRRGIGVGPGRGSAAGSLVCYCLEITDIDPIPYNLLFERFINPERVSLPDIDVDFDEARRLEVVQYMADKYGQDKVAQISNITTLHAKNALRDIFRSMREAGEMKTLAGGVDPDIQFNKDINGLCKLVDSIDAGENEHVLETLMRTGMLDEFLNAEGNPLVAAPRKKLIDMAIKADGIARGRGVHAAGIVVADTAITDYSPTWLGNDKNIVTQYDKRDIEEAGLIKIDFLGLKTVTLIDKAIQNVKESQGIDIDIRNIPLDDPKVFKLYKSAEMEGIFQMESAGMRDCIRKLQPSSLEDLIALIALYRPGPLNSGMTNDFIARARGEADVSYFGLDHLVKDILTPTYGVIVYQEQVMQVARAVAGFTLGQADILRRAMGKKNPAEMASQRGNFIDGAVKNGVQESLAAKLFDMIAKFAEYGFNKSHSAAYALVSYRTAYLKAHYPCEFWAAFLETEHRDVTKLGNYINVAKKTQTILKPDILKSKASFSVIDGKISFGLAGIKGVPSEALADLEILQKAWAEKGAPPSLPELMSQSRNFNKKFMEAMNKAGAFDTFLGGEKYRSSVAFKSEDIMKLTKKAKQELERRKRQGSLLPDDFPLVGGPCQEGQTPKLPGVKIASEWTVMERIHHEAEVLGFCISDDHPVSDARSKCAGLDLPQISSVIADAKENMLDDNGVLKEKIPVSFLASVISREELHTRKGKPYFRGMMEDEGMEIKCVCWPEAWEDVCGRWKMLEQKAIDARNQWEISHSDADEEPPLFLPMAPLENYSVWHVEGILKQDDWNWDGESPLPWQVEIKKAVPVEYYYSKKMDGPGKFANVFQGIYSNERPAPEPVAPVKAQKKLFAVQTASNFMLKNPALESGTVIRKNIDNSQKYYSGPAPVF